MPGERPLGADPWVVETHPDDGYASVTVGIMDVMGAMDGVNDEMRPLLERLRIVEPWLVDGRLHMPFWEVHATRVD